MRRVFLLLAFVSFLISCEQRSVTQQEPVVRETQPPPAQPTADAPEPQLATDTAAAKATPAAATPTEQAVLAIRQEFARINSLPLKTTKRTFVCDVENTITYYTDNGKVVKIAIDWGFLGDGSSRYEYYYQDGKLLFTYKAHTGGPAGLPATRNEERTYVKDDKAINYLKNQESGPCPVCRFTSSSKEYKALKAYTAADVTPALCN